jgi:hypothetical protein
MQITASCLILFFTYKWQLWEGYPGFQTREQLVLLQSWAFGFKSAQGTMAKQDQYFGGCKSGGLLVLWGGSNQMLGLSSSHFHNRDRFSLGPNGPSSPTQCHRFF